MKPQPTVLSLQDGPAAQAIRDNFNLHLFKMDTMYSQALFSIE